MPDDPQLRGRLQYCPKCKTLQKTHAGRPYQFGIDEHRQVESEDFPEINWFRRVRICSVCGPYFVTAEIDEMMIEELIRSRQQLVEQVRHQVGIARARQSWLATREETIPLDLAQRLIRVSAWWLTHSSGHPVPAPGHAKRIEKSRLGWRIEFGANSFLVGKAIERSRVVIIDAFERVARGENVQRSAVADKICDCLAGSVANHAMEEYDYYAPDGSQLVFGAQAIDLDDAADFLIRMSGLSEFFHNQ